MLFGVPALILLSVYIGTSTMEEKNKTGYFIVLAIIVLLLIITQVILG